MPNLLTVKKDCLTRGLIIKYTLVLEKAMLHIIADILGGLYCASFAVARGCAVASKLHLHLKDHAQPCSSSPFHSLSISVTAAKYIDTLRGSERRKRYV